MQLVPDASEILHLERVERFIRWADTKLDAEVDVSEDDYSGERTAGNGSPLCLRIRIEHLFIEKFSDFDY